MFLVAVPAAVKREDISGVVILDASPLLCRPLQGEDGRDNAILRRNGADGFEPRANFLRERMDFLPHRRNRQTALAGARRAHVVIGGVAQQS